MPPSLHGRWVGEFGQVLSNSRSSPETSGTGSLAFPGARADRPAWGSLRESSRLLRTPLPKCVRPGLSPLAFEDASHIARPVAERLPQGSSKSAPPSTSPPSAFPQTEACFGRTSARGPSCSACTVSHRPDGLRHPEGSQACCILQPTMGFTGFRTCGARARAAWSPPPDAIPSRAFPSTAAKRAVTGSPCPPAVRRVRKPAPTSRLCSAGESVAGTDVSAGPCPMLSWASLLESCDRRHAQARTATGTASMQRPWRPTAGGAETPLPASTRPLLRRPARAPRRVASAAWWWKAAALPAPFSTPPREGRPPSLREDPGNQDPGPSANESAAGVLGAPRHRRAAPSAGAYEANLMGRGRVRRAKVVARLSSPPW